MEEVRREGPRASRTMVPSGSLTGHEVASRPVSRTGISLFQIDARILQLVIDQVLSVTGASGILATGRSRARSSARPISGIVALQTYRKATAIIELFQKKRESGPCHGGVCRRKFKPRRTTVAADATRCRLSIRMRSSVAGKGGRETMHPWHEYWHITPCFNVSTHVHRITLVDQSREPP